MAAVKQLFRAAAHSERPSEPVAESVSRWISCTCEFGLSEKVPYQVLYGAEVEDLGYAGSGDAGGAGDLGLVFDFATGE